MVGRLPAVLSRGGSIHPAAEAAGAFLATAAFFLVAAALTPVRGHLFLILALGLAYAYIVFLVATRRGPTYGVPFAIAAGLAFDSFYIAPFREFGADNWQNWLVVGIYISMGVLVGLLATGFRQRAEVSERSRDVVLDEQAALRRVATLVAQDVPAPAIFAAIARELGSLLGLGSTHMARYEPDGTVTGVGSWSVDGRHAPVGSREPLDGTGIMGMVFATGRPARVENYGDATSDRIIAMTRTLGIRSSVGAPIVVDGRLWGVMVVSTTEEAPLPAETESRIAAFTEFAATAISNTEARTRVGQLVDEQAALRRVATLVARGVPQTEVFGAVTEEVGRLLGTDLAGMIRYDADDTVTPVAAWAAVGEHPALPDRWPVEEGDAAALIADVRRPVRVDDWSAIPGPIAAFIRDVGIRSSVANPIIVQGHLWGALAVHTKQSQTLAPDAESRLENFTELVATAIANAEVRGEVARLADEQAALRRVATLVARESPPREVFAAVAEEVSGLLGLGNTMLLRYEEDGTAADVGGFGEGHHMVSGPGRSLILDGDSVTAMVRATGAPARIDDYSRARGAIGAAVRAAGIQAAVGYPIVVAGRLWGCLVAATQPNESMPPDAEARMGQFTELAATSIANVQAHSEMAASRARIVAAQDEERRRVVRDLHDGAQQRLVHTVVTLKLAQRALAKGDTTGPALLRDALDHAQSGMVELRELAHGILPAVLNRGGLRAGVEALASRMPVPVEISVSDERFAGAVEATAYFVVAEALTNVAKHAGAGHAKVVADVKDKMLRIEIADDGKGSADANGPGLLGLADRVASLDGRLEVLSERGGGTTVIATLPLGIQRTSVPPKHDGQAVPIGS